MVTVTISAQTLQGPTTIRQNVHNDVSLPLSVLAKTAPPPETALQEIEPMKRIPLPLGLAPLLEEDPLRQSSVPAAASPAVGMSFEGLGTGQYGFTITNIPPDTDGAVGATQYVQWVNTSFVVFDKATGASSWDP